ncbi:MAG: hypothetical protein JO091_05380, partial [Acidobacteriaceae bacterium]|nr:hypothetical protein [Acidobacteriaceae bacterium]
SAMMLDHLGFADAAAVLGGAVRQVLADGQKLTPDLGGTSNTEEVCQEVIGKIERTTYEAASRS